MFLNNLFTIQAENREANHDEFIIKLNSAHAIYQGHFPDEPITPGVCIIQIAADLFSYLIQQPCSIANVKNVKFLNVIKPLEHETICYQLTWENIDQNSYKIKAIVCTEDITFCKLSLSLQVKPMP